MLAKAPIFCARQNPDYLSIPCESSYYLGEDGNMENKYLAWEPILCRLFY